MAHNLIRRGAGPKLALLLPLLSTPLAAQAGSFVVPSQDIGGNPMTSVQGDFWDLVSFWWNGTSWPGPMRIQHLWSVSDIPVPVASLKSITFRRSHAIASQNPLATAAIKVDLSVGPNTVAGRSVTLSANHGTTMATVYQATLNLPQLPGGSGLPPFTVPIPFANPFLYVASAGNTLVAEFTVTSYVPTTANTTWYLDAVRDGAGKSATNTNNTACKFSNGKYATLNGLGLPKVGGALWAAYGGGLPGGLTGVAIVGFQGAGSVWNGLTLPIDLAPIGAPFCLMATVPTLSLGLTEISTGYYSWPGSGIPVPNNMALAGQDVFDQGVWLEPTANAAGLVVGISTKWTIGSGLVPNGAKLYQYYVSGAPRPNATDGYSTTVSTVAQFGY